MSELIFKTVFQETSRMFKDQEFSVMYFGRHCGKNLIILKHCITIMFVFGDDDQWTAPELIKTVSFRGDRRKGVEIVGNENVVLLLDDCGHLWRLINAFEVSSETNESLHCLKEDCFYEWVPFKKFNFVKVLALTAMRQGFACLGLCGNSTKKLVALPSLESPLENYTFDELNSTASSTYYLMCLNINAQNHIFKNSPGEEEQLLVMDKLSGETYLCWKNGKNLMINVSNNFLVSVLHFQNEKFLLLCLANGKLTFFFYDEFRKQSVLYLSKKLAFVEKCSCTNLCLLWSDGINLNHTKLTLHPGDDYVKQTDLKLNCFIQSPISLLKINRNALVVTINNFYYFISPGVKCASEVKKQSRELLLEICKGSGLAEELEKKIDLLSHYLHCKDMIQKGIVKGKIEMRWEGNNLVIKSGLGITLREDLWKLRLEGWTPSRKLVHVVDLESDFSKGTVVSVENPFERKCQVKVSLIGDFHQNTLYIDLGEVSESETSCERHQLSEELKKILRKRTLLNLVLK